MRRRIVVRNPKLMDYTRDEIEQYFKRICPTLLLVHPLGFGRFEVDFYE